MDFDADSEVPRVRLGELEMNDFKRYANMFYSYRSVSVFSAPECLKQLKKRSDPTPQMDAYSFGMLMWEVLYERLPFEGDVRSAVDYVVKEDSRPLIKTIENTMREADEDDSEEEEQQEAMVLTEDLANIIRRCWQADPESRLSFSTVVKLLMEQQKVLFDND